MKTRKKLVAMVVSVFAVTLFGVPTLAIAEGNTGGTTETTTGHKSTEKQEARLSQDKEKVCRARERMINDKLGRIADRGQKQLNLFSKIATRTEKFYADKGKTLANYDALVAQVNAKKAAAEAAVAAIKADSVTFKCDGANPKGAAANFKAALKSEIAALKEYKTAVRNLIVGVKSVQGETSSTDHKSTGGNR